MAVDVFSEGYIRPSHKIIVARAEFQPYEAAAGGGGEGEGAASKGNKKPRVSHAQVQILLSKFL